MAHQPEVEPEELDRLLTEWLEVYVFASVEAMPA
jgi:hypothetical protein